MWKFFKDFLIYGFASILGKIAAIFLIPIYTSVLTREEYGAMAMLVSVKGIIDLVSNLNIHSGIARDYYEKDIDRKTLVSTGLWSIISLSCTILILMLLSKSFWLDNVLELSDYNSSFILVLLSIPAGGLVSYFAILTRFKKKSIQYSLGNIIALAIRISISIFTILVLKWGIFGLFVATLFDEVFCISYFGYICREYFSFKFNWKYLKRVLKYSLPVLPAIAAGWIDTSLGQLLMGRYVSLNDLGVYSIAISIVTVFSLIGVALNNVWQPFLFENYKREGFQKEVERLYLTFVTILCIVTCTLSLLSKEIVLILSNPNYLDASLYLTILCIPSSFYLLFPIASSGISISRDTKHTSFAYIIGSSFNLVFLVTLLPIMGVFTVPIGLVFSRILTYSYMSYITKKKGLFILPDKIMITIVIIATICFLIIYSNTDFIYRLLAIILINGVLLYWANKKLGLKSMLINIINKKISKK